MVWASWLSFFDGTWLLPRTTESAAGSSGKLDQESARRLGAIGLVGGPELVLQKCLLWKDKSEMQPPHQEEWSPQIDPDAPD